MATVIKRYANRKLYDSTAKRYVKLEELAQLVKDGQEVQIIDNSTGADITSVVLSKVLSEVISDKPENGHVSSSVLREIIQKRSDAVVDYVKQGIEASVRTVKDVEQQLQQQFQQSWKRVTGQQEPTSSPTEDFKLIIQRMIEESVQFLIGKMNLPTRTEINELNRRLDEIEKRVKPKAVSTRKSKTAKESKDIKDIK
jgi:polyhydroxyalkanoate synthesis repressor PhaR